MGTKNREQNLILCWSGNQSVDSQTAHAFPLVYRLSVNL
jgi:hypothetical protein